MDTATLQVFVDVLQQGSFAAVARQRNVDPSSISRIIRALEDELGLRLFQRTTRRLEPTEAGVLYFERIRPLLEELDRARLEASDMAATPTGNLRVTASVSFGHRWLVPLLPDLLQRYPELSVDLVLTDSLVDLIAERIDVAIRLGSPADSGLVGTKLMPTRYRVCASPGYIESHGTMRSPQELSERDCVLFPFSGYRTEWRFRSTDGAQTAVRVHGKVVISNALSLHRAALDGLGPVLLADWLVGDDIAGGALVDLFPEHAVTAEAFDTAAWILYPSRAYVPLKVRAFIEFLQSRAERG